MQTQQTPRAPHRWPNAKPLVVLMVEADLPLVQACGGRNVTEDFFDNDHRSGGRAGVTPYYDFIHGEPYGNWT